MQTDKTTSALLAEKKVEVEKDYKGILNHCEVKITDIIGLPPVCIEIGKQDNYATIGTLGNFSLVIGKAKAGKTFALSLILAASLVAGIPFQDALRVCLPPDKNRIIYFDTEQSKYHVHNVLKRICSLSGKTIPDNLTVYSLRGFTAAERLEIIEYVIHNTSNIGLVVIDGIRDLITSINDEEQASMITSKILKWTEDLIIHIITVLHQNKGDLNARGHLGTELTNKAETVISVSKASDNKEVSVLSAEYCRSKEFNPFAFSIDVDGLPFIINDFTQSVTMPARRKKIAPYDVPPESHKHILKDVFSIQPDMMRSELRKAASANISRHLGYDIGVNKTDDWITHWQHFKHIITTGTPGTKACKYSIKKNDPTEINDQSTELT